MGGGGVGLLFKTGLETQHLKHTSPRVPPRLSGRESNQQPQLHAFPNLEI